MSRRLPQSEKTFIPGPAGRLEARLETPAGKEPRGAVVVCHPHPQHGGTMHNKVAYTLARSFVQMDFAALRFNFRGTQASEGEYDEGVGELDDALAALEWLRGRYPDGPLWSAGFSFGAAIAIRAALDMSLAGLITVAPAVRRFASGLEDQPQCPWLIVQGDQDDVVDVDETVRWVDELLPGPELIVLPETGHFFHGKLINLREIVTDFVQSQPW